MSTLLNNRYRTLQILGSGLNGKTYLAEDTHLPSNRRCVIKQLRPPTESAALYKIIKERFHREAVILELLGKSTEQIPTLHAYFAEEQEFYLVQDWIEGKSLAQRVHDNGPFTIEQVKDFLTRLLPVLEFVHSQGIVHRDIKPENIMLRDRDDLPMLIDFGAVKEVVADSATTIIIGSPGFMAPEQANGQPVFSSDLYSLGLTAAFLLSGKRPQELIGVSAVDRLAGELEGDSAAALLTVIKKATRPIPDERYQSAREMLEALEDIDEPTVLLEDLSTNSKRVQPRSFRIPFSSEPDAKSSNRREESAKRISVKPYLIYGAVLIMITGLGIVAVALLVKRQRTAPLPVAAQTSASTQTAEFEITRTNDLYTSVRAAPRTSSPELGRVYPESKIVCQTTTVKGETLWANNEWRYCPSVGGYIHSTLLRPSQP